MVSTTLLLEGCGTGAVHRDSAPAPDARAETLFNGGDYAAAASEYLSLAQQFPDDAISYQLKAAHAYINLGDIDKAGSIINSLEPAGLDENTGFYQAVLTAKIAVAARQPEQALSLLDLDIPRNAGMDMIRSLYETRAESFELQGLYIDAVRERIILADYLTGTGQARTNTTRIWSYLAAMDQAGFAELNNSRLDAVGPWLELVSIGRALISKQEEMKKAIAAWSSINPQHPANPFITSQLLAASERFAVLPGQIALLLPLTGPYERYSERIRDGFVSAWFNEKGYKPQLRIYNTDTLNIAEIYQKAIAEGADFVVGPLEKEAVRVLADMEDIPVRTLALNQVDNTDVSDTPVPAISPDLIQFGLPPEDEARQVAQRGIFEGYNRVLAITSADEYGDRVYRAFSNEWTNLGGTILERIIYDPQTTDYITPVKQLLNIDSSETRITALRNRLGRSMAVSGRLREDADFIFMVASSLTARQIVPHLRFFRVETLPIYSISSVFTGSPDPQVDSDLDGVEFVDMPWLLGPENDRSGLHRQISSNWRAASSVFPRYYAFGIDAFRLIQHLGELSLSRNYKYQGETGDLYMTDTGIIHRNLLWARFVNGEPRSVANRNLP
jgi:outer membrane PBP1 activator LpoA protein